MPGQLERIEHAGDFPGRDEVLHRHAVGQPVRGEGPEVPRPCLRPADEHGALGAREDVGDPRSIGGPPHSEMMRAADLGEESGGRGDLGAEPRVGQRGKPEGEEGVHLAGDGRSVD